VREAASSTAELIRETCAEWWHGSAPRLGAALSYYTVFSLAPVLVLAIAVAGAVFGADAARGMIVAQLGDVLGTDAARALEALIQRASIDRDGSVWATVFAVATMLFGASGAFGQLQTALNEVWDVEPSPRTGFWRIARQRLLSFGMVVVIGFLLLVSLVLATAVAALDKVVGGHAPLLQPLLGAVQLAISLGLATLLFAAIFRVLPDRPIRWADVWVGAAVTALLFEIGKTGIAFYIARSGVASLWGAAGSLVVVLLWVYYSAQILFFGAEFTQVWSRRHRPPAAVARLSRRPSRGAEARLRLVNESSQSPHSKR
jgi:membrane protein